jgi:hypothetical protein
LLAKDYLGYQPERDRCLAIMEHTNAEQDLVIENDSDPVVSLGKLTTY